MKIKINPKYEEMRSFIERIPDVFEKEGHVIYTGRNLIKVMKAPDGTLINVKRYHVPKVPNSLVYSLGIRKPKGERAFEYPMILEKKGIGTPAPIALIEERNAIGLLGYTYLITLQCDNLHTLYEVGDAGALRAALRPYFLRSFILGSRVRKPAFLSFGRSASLSY